MDSAAPEPQVDLTAGADDVVDSQATSKGHRGLDDTWDHFKKIKLDSELIELFEGYAAADVNQKEDDYFVSDSSCTVDLDYNHPAIDES
ncbi:TPA: hypothetical protein ACH3X1_012028 [Trebouxia sp. C0004]